MQSHQYDIPHRQLLLQIGLTLLPLAAFALALHAGRAANLWPKPLPTLDVDRTILFHQAQQARTRDPSNLLLVGDSSCLMNVHAAELELPAGYTALNLGTLSYLDPNDYALLLRQFDNANPGQLTAIVLLMHPEALRTAAPSEFHRTALRHFTAGTDSPDTPASPIANLTGVSIFRTRLLPRLVPIPLPGEYGRFYGFNRNLSNYLTAHRGSAIDPGGFNINTTQGNAEYRIPERMLRSSRAFRAALPPNVKLIAGITPVPEGFAGPEYPHRYHQLLNQWSSSLQPDAILSELPPVMPDHQFASVTHLNPSGRQMFTATLGRALRHHLE